MFSKCRPAEKERGTKKGSENKDWYSQIEELTTGYMCLNNRNII